MQRAAARAGSGRAIDAGRVLAFWFGDDPDDPRTAQRQAHLWWEKDPALDARIRERFGEWRRSAIAGELHDWAKTPRGRLALIVLVDQFSRNLFRGDPESFRHDPLARAWTLDGIAAGDDATLRPIERVFFYLPLEHSERLADQERSVTLYESLLPLAPAAMRASFENFLDYAKRHRDIVARFGHFPHRNAILRRVSTPEEVEFLKQPGSSF